MNNASFALVIVTHNSAPWLPDFFASWSATVAASRLLQSRDHQIIIADSGSTDTTPDLARQHHATFLPCGNIGFGAAANRGIAAANSTWVLLCNPDLLFPTPFAATLIDPVLDDLGADPVWQNAACIAPRLLNPDGTPQPSIGQFPTLATILRDQFRPRQHRKYIHRQPQSPGLIDWATGACLLLKSEPFTALGGFDEQFFLYVEEVDLQRRLRASGRGTWFAPDATVTHHAPNAARAPRANVQQWSARGMLRYFAKHGTVTDLLGYKLLALLSRRLPLSDVLSGRAQILHKSTNRTPAI